jgi:hypothetical protein
MNETRFDALTRALAAPAPRRATLRLLAGGLLGAWLAPRGGAPVRAQRLDSDLDGLFDDDEINIYGTDLANFDTDGDGAGDGEEVFGGTDPLTPGGPAAPPPANGPCPEGQADCGAGCIDITSDALNCGGCGLVCPPGDICQAAFCVAGNGPPPGACAQLGATCATDADCCVGYCGQDPICACVADGQACYPSGTGGCCNGQPCNADGFCGVCGMLGARCDTDGECCQGSLCCFNGTVLDTVCTEVYSTGGFCPGDAPVPGGCPAGQTDCGGNCVDLLSHAGHCGACFNACPLGGACQAGVCGGVVCVAGQTDCGGTCVDLASDEFHCGACFTSCPLGGYCSGGVCGGLICQDGLVDCYGRCVDLDLDWQNCGACGVGCFEGTTCIGGVCYDRPWPND